MYPRNETPNSIIVVAVVAMLVVALIAIVALQRQSQICASALIGVVAIALGGRQAHLRGRRRGQR